MYKKDSELKLPWAKKALGQHFLKDEKIILKICSDFHLDCSGIIEVGPGPGILTKHLSKYEKPLVCIEKDDRMQDYLNEHINSNQLIVGDALELDFEQLISSQKLPQKDLWLVSNLPYNISVPLTIAFSKHPQISFMTLMVQKEVGERILPSILPIKEQKNGMNSLHALLGTWFDIALLTKVPPGAFLPPPKVDSVVLRFKRKDNPVLPMSEFLTYESFLRKLFQNRRKQVHGVLRAHYPAEKIESVFKELNLDLKARAETFNLEQVQLLYSQFKKK